MTQFTQAEVTRTFAALSIDAHVAAYEFAELGSTALAKSTLALGNYLGICAQLEHEQTRPTEISTFIPCDDAPVEHLSLDELYKQFVDERGIQA